MTFKSVKWPTVHNLYIQLGFNVTFHDLLPTGAAEYKWMETICKPGSSSNELSPHVPYSIDDQSVLILLGLPADANWFLIVKSFILLNTYVAGRVD